MHIIMAIDENEFYGYGTWTGGQEFFEDNREYWPHAFLMYLAM